MSEHHTLADIYRRESRNLLQYVLEAFPWAKGNDELIRHAVMQAAGAENTLVAELGRQMQKRHMSVPSQGSFPTSFTNFNFVSVSYLLPRLIADQRRSLADLERDLPNVHDAGLRGLLETLRDAKKSHLHDLESGGTKPHVDTAPAH